ncbi:hypothetical protein GGS23DRAFT_616107, partial [Durotheca rogersii]|uniref:uncharacterized protein n=1 Tax=Durotheca rogersii TaxID=419775 RepID=UPI00221F351E
MPARPGVLHGTVKGSNNSLSIKKGSAQPSDSRSPAQPNRARHARPAGARREAESPVKLLLPSHCYHEPGRAAPAPAPAAPGPGAARRSRCSIFRRGSPRAGIPRPASSRGAARRDPGVAVPGGGGARRDRPGARHVAAGRAARQVAPADAARRARPRRAHVAAAAPLGALRRHRQHSPGRPRDLRRGGAGRRRTGCL